MPGRAQPVQLFELHSRSIDAVLHYLEAVETDLSVNPLLDRFGLKLDALRIPLKVIPHRLGDHEAALRRQEAARGEFRTRRPDREEDGAAALYATDIRPKDVTPEPLATIEAKLKFGVILGNPGSGKSEWLKDLARLTARAARRELAAHKALEDRVCLPLFLHLRDVAGALTSRRSLAARLIEAGALEVRPRTLSRSERAAAALLWAASQRWERIPSAAGNHDVLVWSPQLARVLWRKLTLFHGNRPDEVAPLLCLDGWDECAEHHRLLAPALRDYGGSTRARVFLTSRMVGYGDNPLFDRPQRDDPKADRRELRLCPFDYGDTSSFITGFFGEARRDTAMRLIEELRGKYAVVGMAQNPLLTTFLCMAYQPDPDSGKTLDLPLRRVELYDHILRGLLGEWPDKRAMRSATLAAGGGPSRKALIEPKLALLRQLAARLAEERPPKQYVPRQVITQTELSDFLWGDRGGYLNQLPATHPLHQAIDAHPSHEMAEILCSDGMLMRVGADSYAFIHLTFQEYLTADALAARGWPAIAERIDRVSWHPAWEETVVMLAGRLKDPKPLLDLLLDETTNDVLHHRIILAACCLPEIDRVTRKKLSDPIGKITETAVAGAQMEARVGDHDPAFFQIALAAVAMGEGIYDGLPMLRGLQRRLERDDREAIKFIRWIGPAAATEGILAALDTLLVHPDSDVRKETLFAVNRLRKAAVTPAILEAWPRLLREDHLGIGLIAAGELVRNLGWGASAATPEFVSGLLPLLRDSDWNARANAVYVFSHVNLGAAAATPEIIEAVDALLVDENLYVQLHAPRAARKLRAQWPIAKTSDATGRVREVGHAPGIPLRTIAVLDAMHFVTDFKDPARLAELVLDFSASEGTPEAPVLALLGAASWELRATAARTIAHLHAEPITSDVVAGFSALLSDKDARVRAAAAEAVGSLTATAITSEVVAGFSALLSDKDARVRAAAAKAVGSLKATAMTSEVLVGLSVLLGDENASVRANAAEVVGHLPAEQITSEVLVGLAALLGDENASVRANAAEAVGHLPAEQITSEVLVGLSVLLGDENASVRANAAEVVGRLPAEQITSEVLAGLAQLARDPNRNIRVAVAHAIGRLTSSTAASPEILATYIDLLRDEDVSVRRAAVESVRDSSAASLTEEVLATLAALLLEDELLRDVSRTLGRLGFESAGTVFRDELKRLTLDQRERALLEVLPYWPEARLFSRGEDWVFVTVPDLVNGFHLFAERCTH